MAAPQLGLAAFFELAHSLDMAEVEIRNDIAGKPILDGTAPAAVRAEAERAGVTVATINALQRFNQWSPERAVEATELAGYARDCGAKALILVPANDGSGRQAEERQASVREALTALKPILSSRGLIGLVEPLGFEASSLRSKREAIEAIRAVEGEDVFKVTHDTFHHHLAGEPEIFPQATGLIHISGVEDASLEVAQMRDAHRVLVGPQDRLGNVEQIRSLLTGGYRGPVSFEPFAEELRHLEDPAAAIRESVDFINERLGSDAARQTASR
jgi:2-keto-myo-inositol isomerase